MNKWIKILLTLVVVGIFAGLLGYKFVYNKPHTDFEKEKAVWTISAEDLYNGYKENQVAANEKYLGQVVEISGQLSAIEENNGLVVFAFVFEEGMFGDEGVRCTFLDNQKEDVSALKPGDDIKLKGYCTGYNETDVILEKCSFVKK